MDMRVTLDVPATRHQLGTASCFECDGFVLRRLDKLVVRDIVFCSKRCAGYHQKPRPSVIQTYSCLECGEQFQRLPGIVATRHRAGMSGPFCNRSCAQKWVRARRV